MTLTRRVARPMLASTFVFGGIQALRNTPKLAEASKPVNDEIRDLARKVAPQVHLPEDDKTLVRINAGVHIVAGLGLATGRASPGAPPTRWGRRPRRSEPPPREPPREPPSSDARPPRPRRS